VHFADSLMAAIVRIGNPVCVGIDPRAEDLPDGFLDQYPGTRAGVASAFEEFGRKVIEVVAPLVPAVKFQAAFYEAYGPEGMSALHATSEFARSSGLIVIIDGKRNDIGSTAEAYARAYLGKVPIGEHFRPSWDADALTINPYLGSDGIAPFIKVATREGKGIFVLVRTSNASAGEFQDLVADGKPIYRHVAERIAVLAHPHRGDSGYSLVGAVVGATYPSELAELRAFDASGLGALINNSRGITFAYRKPAAVARFGDDWRAAIAQAVRDMVKDLASHTTTARFRDRA
jgi:orotidine-5'-phosphate decarboxylase